LLSEPKPALGNTGQSKDGVDNSLPSTLLTGLVRTIPVPGGGPDQPQNEPFAPTLFDQLPIESGASVKNLPYSSYLEAIQFAIPGVFDLVSLIGGTRYETKTSENRHSRRRYVTGEHIVVAEVLAKDENTVRWHDIDCANANSLEQQSQILRGAGSREEVAVRYLVMDDISARAVEVLGHSFSIDPSVFVKHLHQILEGCSVENVRRVTLPCTGFRTHLSPFPLHTVSAPFAMGDVRCGSRNDQTHMVICPTDMHVVPAVDRLERVPMISSAFEEQQLQRVPRRNDVDVHETLLNRLGRRSFMRPTICKDFGPYLPVWPMPGDDDWKFAPFQRITFDRSDHAIIHVPGNVVVPTGKVLFTACISSQLTLLVIILRTPSDWNKPIHASKLRPIHDELSDKKTRWKVLASPDCFRFCIGPDVIHRSPASSRSDTPVGENSQSHEYLRSGPGPDHNENLTPNSALCKILVEWHRRCLGENASLLEASIPAQIYFLERALSRLSTLTADDYKRAYDQCSDKRLKIGEQRRLLDYCRSRAMRWERLEVAHARMLDQVCDSISRESEMAQKFLSTCGNRLRSLIQQIEDQLQKTKEFVSLQLEHIAADQQRELVHNQIELSQLQIAESRKAIQQTETVRKLTMLAFVFIPTSTICSFFGMNIKELDEHPRIWIFFVTLIAVVTIVLIIAAADGLLTFLMRVFAAMPAVPRGGEPRISQIKGLVALFLLKSVHAPFALLSKAILTISRKWSLFMSEGRAYRTGYQDPSRLKDSESRTQATPLTSYIQKGAYMAYLLRELFQNYQRKWREFWSPSNKEMRNNAPIEPSATPYYTASVTESSITEP
jgi:CorA-like Mg2+ transporter protein